MYEELKEAKQRARLVHGVAEPAFGYITTLLSGNSTTPISLVILPDNKQLDQAVEDLGFFFSLSEHKTKVLPFPEYQFGNSANLEPQLDRLGTLTQLANKQKDEIFQLVTTISALTAAVPAKEALRRSEIKLYTGISYSFSQLVDQLNELGYDHESEVEGPGQFAVRGGIIDLYPVNALLPYRLDFFGDEIEDIRTFEPDSQRSQVKVESLIIAAPPGKQLEESKTGILEYLEESTTWYFWEPVLCETNNPDFFSNRSEQLTLAKVFESRFGKDDQWIGISELDDGGIFFNQKVKKTAVESEKLEQYRSFPANESLGMDRFYQEQEERLRFFKQIQSWEKED
jgi:transcription-repair coupling factor (superfamily II helicase)